MRLKYSSLNRCDWNKCLKVKGSVSVSIFQQKPYKMWGTVHMCPTHQKKLKELLMKNIRTKIE